MRRGDLADAEWERLRPFLPVSNGHCGRWREHRQVIDGILHRVRIGVQWRDLPERSGPGRTPGKSTDTVSRTVAPSGSGEQMSRGAGGASISGTATTQHPRRSRGASCPLAPTGTSCSARSASSRPGSRQRIRSRPPASVTVASVTRAIGVRPTTVSTRN
ncbi:transposase [Streptomyces aureoversilis]|uniref:Transposase n=1 Tax=Streptomyces aureoversilis TaxID=67277 RepID=A0ABV9ZPY2_9ACTN